MRLHLAHFRRIARLLAGVFAVQVIAAGACLMVPEAHAMPMTSNVSVMEHCDNMEMAAGMVMSPSGEKPKMHTHRSGCPHCDQPDGMAVSHISIDHAAGFVALLPTDLNTIQAAVTTSSVAVPVPTGPPRSASLIFQTTQRIRI